MTNKKNDSLTVVEWTLTIAVIVFIFAGGFTLGYKSADYNSTYELGNAICQEQNEFDSIPLPDKSSLVKQYRYEFDTYSDGILKCKPVKQEPIKEVKYDGIIIQIEGDPK